jgi:ABC-type nickel/cobalt efflux system permease component RcnA
MAGAGKEKPVKPLGWIWSIGLLVGMLACLPAMLEALFAKTYETHRHGVAVVTCASTPLGKAAVEALIEDGYLVSE